MSSSYRHILMLIVLSFGLLGCQNTTSQDIFLAKSDQFHNIVGGNIETGWDGVGALTTINPQTGYMGSHCTGTLIDPNWVLTSAQCITNNQEREIDVRLLRFYVGNDASPESETGTFYQADMLVPHPLWNPVTFDNDIGLVHLAEAATGISTYPISNVNIPNAWSGDSIFYVGFGVNNESALSGNNIKRSTWIPISDIVAKQYQSEYIGSSICFGDLGGPGLRQISGIWTIIGVNSSIYSSNPNTPCQGTFFHTRVDVFSDWINDQLTSPEPNCNSNASLCFCHNACQNDGSCNNDLCKIKNCKENYSCMTECGESLSCAASCYLSSTDQARQQLIDMNKCLNTHCSGLNGDAYISCTQQYCQAEVDLCLSVSSGTQSCAFMDDCLSECPPGDPSCQQECLELGSPEAQSQIDAMYACFNDHCSSESNEGFQDCIDTHCSAEICNCKPPLNCEEDAGSNSSDTGTITEDSSMPEPDAATILTDAGEATADGSSANSDAFSNTPDADLLDADTVFDASATSADSATLSPDANTHDHDASTLSPDAAFETQDAGAISSENGCNCASTSSTKPLFAFVAFLTLIASRRRRFH